MCGCILVSHHHQFDSVQGGLITTYLIHKYDECPIYVDAALCNDETGLYLDERSMGTVVFYVDGWIGRAGIYIKFLETNIYLALNKNNQSDGKTLTLIHNNHTTTDGNQILHLQWVNDYVW